jgi:mycofactocin system creatininase family protein
MSRLADRVWTGVPDGATVLVPVGSTEQHGPHLPLDTDTVIAEAVCRRVAEMLDDPALLVTPAIAFGSSGEHQDFPGTVSIGTEALRMMVTELVRSLRTWAGRVVLVNGHGGNVVALARAVDQLRREGHDVCWLACESEDLDLHAGRSETSLLLHLCPQRVRLEAAAIGNTDPIDVLLPALVRHGVRPVAPNGVLGDPTHATATEGGRLLDEMARRFVDLLTAEKAH